MLVHTRMLAFLGEHTLRDFPDSLPEPLRGFVSQTVVAFDTALHDLAEGRGEEWMQAARRVIELMCDPNAPREPLALARMAFTLYQVSLHQRSAQFAEGLWDFKTANGYQAVAMTFSSLDAFFGDSVRTALCSRPEALRRNKKIEWAEVLALRTRKELEEHLAEQLVYEFGWQTSKARVAWLKQELGLELSISEAQLDTLHLWEQRRHLIVHNGGIVNSRYLRETRDPSLEVGAKVTASSGDLDLLLETALCVGAELYHAVSIKFLGLKDGAHELHGVREFGKNIAVPPRDSAADSDVTTEAPESEPQAV